MEIRLGLNIIKNVIVTIRVTTTNVIPPKNVKVKLHLWERLQTDAPTNVVPRSLSDIHAWSKK